MRIKHISYQALGLVARKGLLGLAFLSIARVLGPKDFGEFSYVYTWVYMFTLISSLGFSPVSTREIARAQETASAILNSALWIRLVASSVASLLLVGVFWWTPLGQSGVRSLVLVLSVTILPMAIIDQLAAYAMGFEGHSQFALINFIQWGVYFCATLFGLASSHDLSRVLVWQCAGLWVSLVLCVCLFSSQIIDAFARKVDWQLATFLVREAIPLALTNVLGMLYFRIGTLQLYNLRGSRETGFYTSSLQVVEAMQLIPMAVVGAMFPEICRAACNSERFSVLFERDDSVLLFASLFVAATGSILSGPLITCIFGRGFSASGRLLATLIWSTVPIFLHIAFAYFLIAANMQRAITINAVAGVIVSVTFNLLLIPRYGALGAVYGSVITESAICVLHLAFISRRVQIPRNPTLLIPLSGACVVLMLGFLWNGAINATLLSQALFGIFALGLCSASFLLYQRLQTQRRIA